MTSAGNDDPEGGLGPLEIWPHVRPPRQEGDPRYFYVHMQKAAGTSFILRLYLHFPEAAIYPNPDDGDVQAEAPQGDVAGLLERWPARRDDIQVIAGHFPLCTTRLLGEEFRTMTVLRDPVERTLSYLRHRRVLVAEDRDKSLEEIYDDPWAFPLIIENHMTRMLALEPEEVTWGPLSQMPYTPERLEQAKANLAAIDVFGLQDHMGEFWTDVQERFSWQLPPMPRFNTTEPVPVGDSLRARIAADNAYDMELWRYAQDLYASRRTERG